MTDGGIEPIDCALMYAREHCQCARDACFATGAADLDVGLRLSEDGSLSGSLWDSSEFDAALLVLQRTP